MRASNHPHKIIPTFVEHEVSHKKLVALFFAVGLMVGLLTANIIQAAHASGMSTPNTYNPAAVTITGGTINNAAIAGGTINNAAIGATTPAAINATSVTVSGGAVNASIVNATNTLNLGGKILGSANLPNVTLCGTSPTINAPNGTTSFSLTTGTGVFSACQINFPVAAATSWICNITNPIVVTIYLYFSPNNTTNSFIYALVTSTGATANIPTTATLYITCTAN